MGLTVRRLGLLPLSFCVMAFVLLATMNSAGYRYGASDQAFYIPAVLRHLDAALFPRDGALIESQARLTIIDDLASGIIQATGVSLQHLFLALYLVSLVLLLLAAARISAHLFRTQWAIVAVGAALTLRHAIAKTGANTLEGYFHPRQLAFALGLLAVAAFLERRDRQWLPLLALAGAVHPTTTLWFAVWLGVAYWLARPGWRKPLAIAALVLGVAGITAIFRGPLAGHLAPMDAEWLAVIADRDYLFPVAWPLNVWCTNLLAIPVIVWCWRARQRAGVATDRETPLIAGVLSLAVVFFCWLPFNAVHLALAVEMQVTRVFWMLDILGTIFLVGWLAEGIGTPARARGAIVVTVIVLLSLCRGVYSTLIQFSDRPIFGVDLQHSDWRDAMAWARTTAPGSGWLADPVHAARYGSSLRAAAHRDVFLEQLKDRAIAMYARDTAMRVADRERALAATPWDTAEGARALAARFDLDYLVIERELPLPLAHRSGALFIYRLR